MNKKFLSFVKGISYAFHVFLFLFLGLSLSAQSQITGKVTDKNGGEALPFVYVVVKGTTIATSTQENGTYQLTNVPNGATLVFSTIGYKTQEVSVGARRVVDVVMEEDATLLGDIVVTALGISREKKALGYAVQNVQGDELSKVRTDNIISSLSGRVAGVNVVTASGQMGGGAKINVRGNTSLFGNNQPLFVVDGIPISNADYSYGARGAGGYDLGNLATDLNADDIESMSILKGASASALYGSRAANGVVMVTTKKAARAENNKWGVSVNSSVSVDKATYMPTIQKLYGGGFDYTGYPGTLDGFLTCKINGKTYRYVDFASDESWGPAYDPNVKVLQWNSFDPWDTANYLVEKPWVYPANDYKTYFQNGVTYQNNIQIAKANETGSMRLSYTNQKTTGIVPNSSLLKHTVSISGTSTFNKFVDGWVAVNYVNQGASGRPEHGYGERNPVQKMWQWSHTQLDYKELRDYINPDGTQRTWNRNDWDDPEPAFTDNPYWSAYKNYQNDKRNRMYGNTGINLKITDYLKLTGRAGIDWHNATMEERFAVGSYDTPEYYLENRQAMEANLDFFLTFNKRVANDLVGVTVMAGGNSSMNQTAFTGGITQSGLVIPDLYVLSNSVVKATAYDSKSRKKVNALFGNLTMDYNQLIFLDVTARNDWSSTLPVENRSYFYPSVNLSFLLSSLDGLKKFSWLNFAKLRGGWAQVGNDTAPYRLINYYSASSPFDGHPRYSPPATMNNPALRPEKTTSWEVGLDARLFDNRLGIDLAYYQKKTTDQIIPVMVSGASGYGSMYMNAGIMTNKGIELTLNGAIVKSAKNGFNWDVQFNIATLNNLVVEVAEGTEYLNLENGPFRVSCGAMAGESYPIIRGTNYIFDDQGNRLINPKTGAYLATSEGVAIGKVIPDFTAGMTNTFRFKNIDLSVLFDMQRGGSMYFTSYMWGMYSGMLEETAAIVNGENVRDAGIVPKGVYGSIVKDDTGKITVTYLNADGSVSAGPVQANKPVDMETYCSRFYDTVDAQNVFSTNFIKLREVRLGYTLPNKLTGAVKDVRFSAYGRNLAIFGLENKHFDPEYLQMAGSNTQGIEGGYIPSTRSFGFSVSFNF